ncbi:MAG: RidA family protein [Gaiellaceae bacterium]
MSAPPASDRPDPQNTFAAARQPLRSVGLFVLRQREWSWGSSFKPFRSLPALCRKGPGFRAMRGGFDFEPIRLLAMGRIESRLSELGLTLPAPLTPPGNFQLVKMHNGLAYIAGHGPFDGPTPLVQGLVGRDLTVDEGYQAARMTGLSMLASLKAELDDLDRVTQWIRAVGYVHCEPGFAQNATVVNGFSDLIIELWGDAGRHARSAPGQGPSPLNVPIIVDAIAAVD